MPPSAIDCGGAADMSIGSGSGLAVGIVMPVAFDCCCKPKNEFDGATNTITDEHQKSEYEKVKKQTFHDQEVAVGVSGGTNHPQHIPT